MANVEQAVPGTSAEADRLVRRYYEVLSAYEPEFAASALADVLSENFIFHPPNNVDGYPGFARHLEWLQWHHRTLAEQHFVIEDLLTDGSTAATRWTLTGVSTGEFLGVPASGSRIAVTGQDFFRLRNGKLTEMWRSMDLREVVRQLKKIA